MKRRLNTLLKKDNSFLAEIEFNFDETIVNRCEKDEMEEEF